MNASPTPTREVIQSQLLLRFSEATLHCPAANETENAFRSLTIGRKNWLFVGSRRGGEVAAMMYSLVSSAARRNIDVWAYGDDCLRQLAGGSADYASLLPDVWRQSHPQSIRHYRDAEQESRRLTTQQRRIRRREARVA